MDKDFYTIQEFAEKLGVSTHTVRRAINKGRISAFRVGAAEKSPYRIAHVEIDRMGVFDLNKLIENIVEKQIKERDKS